MQQSRNKQVLLNSLIIAAMVEIAIRSVDNIPSELTTDQNGNTVSKNLVKSLVFSSLREDVIQRG